MEQPSTNKNKKGIFDDMNIHRAMADMTNFRKDYKDPLSLLLNLTLEPLKFKIVVLGIVLVISVYSLAVGLAIFRILSTFDEENLLKYGSFVGIDIVVLINFWTVFLKYKEMLWFAEVITTVGIPLTENVIGEQKYKKVHLMILVLKVAVLVNIGLALVAAFEFTASPEYFNKKSYSSVWVKENFPDYAEYILFCFHLTNFPVAVVLSSSSIVMSYFVYSSVLQLILMNQIVEGICDSNVSADQRYTSEIFQMSVKTKLKISIMFHSTVARLGLRGVEIVYAPLYAFTVAGVILGGSLLLEFFTNDPSEISNQYFGIVCFTLAGGITATLYVSGGQHLKDESERTLSLLNQLPWYYMNEENLKIYRIFSLMAEKPITLGNNVLEVNYLLLVRVKAEEAEQKERYILESLLPIPFVTRPVVIRLVFHLQPIRICKAIYSIAALISQFVSSTAGTTQ